MAAEGVRFDLGALDLQRDPRPALRLLRAAGPVARGRLPLLGDVRLVTTYDAVNEVLKNDEEFVRDFERAGRKGLPAAFRWAPPLVRHVSQNMLSKDEPDHRRLRGLVTKAFQNRSLEEFRGRIETICDRFLAGLENRERVDLVSEFARPFPLLVICELLGLPEEDRTRFTLWMRGFSQGLSPWGLGRMMFRMSGLVRYLKRRFEVSRRQPGSGLIDALVQAEEAGDRLNEDELLAMVFLLFIAGHETTVYLLSGAAATLLEHPPEKHRLMADPGLMPSAVEELLRYVSPVQFSKPRLASRDLTLHGKEIRRGEMVLPIIAAANFDPERFPDPERLDLSRSPNPHLSFGSGIHFCLGAHLARMEAAIALRKLLSRFPELRLAVPPEELQWGKRVGLRALSALPVCPGPGAPAA